MSRAEAFLRAGEQWLLADDPRRGGERASEQAMADGGGFVDPRAPLARALFVLGRRPRPGPDQRAEDRRAAAIRGCATWWPNC